MTSVERLLSAYQNSLAEINGASLVAKWGVQQKLNNIYVLAVGKAAAAMARGAAQIWGDKIQQALVITNQGSRSECPFEIHFAAHPLLDESSLRAGQQVQTFVQNLPDGATLLVLLSGGASALMEVLPDSLTLDDYQKIMRYLLSNHFDITSINAIRKRLSLIKGGALLHATPATVNVIQCLISDVPQDQLSMIGSGPFMVETSTAMPDVPLWIQQKLRAPIGRTNTAKVDNHLLTSNELWLRLFVRHLNIQSQIVGMLYDDVVVAAEQCANFLQEAPSGVYIWGGELTVKLPPKAGRGGRLQHFTLALLSKLGSIRITILAASSDGRDGQSNAAGVLLSSEQCQRLAQCKPAINEALLNANSYAFWQRHGGQLFCSATETNVADIIVIIKE